MKDKLLYNRLIREIQDNIANLEEGKPLGTPRPLPPPPPAEPKSVFDEERELAKKISDALSDPEALVKTILGAITDAVCSGKKKLDDDGLAYCQK